MKDKRQRLSLVWPYNDPHFAAYMFNLASTNSLHRYAACAPPVGPPNPFLYGMYGNYRPSNPSLPGVMQYPFPTSRSDPPAHHSFFKPADMSSCQNIGYTPHQSPVNWSPKPTPTSTPKSTESAIDKDDILIHRTPLFQALLSSSGHTHEKWRIWRKLDRCILGDLSINCSLMYEQIYSYIKILVQ